MGGPERSSGTNRRRSVPSGPDARASDPTLARRSDDVFETLETTYGRHTWESHGAPLDELVGTVLSQNTSNVNTARSFRALRDRFPDWEAVIAAPTEDVEAAIRSGGLARIKAPRIQSILRSVLEREGSLSLDRLRAVALDQALTDLTAMKGVGPKTAACVMLFSLGRPAMPVDTHVHRLSLRIGLVPGKTSAERCQPALEALIGPDRDRILTAHLNLIRHGQRVCRARRPDCGACPLVADCDYFTGRGDWAATPSEGRPRVGD